MPVVNINPRGHLVVPIVLCWCTDQDGNVTPAWYSYIYAWHTFISKGSLHLHPVCYAAQGTYCTKKTSTR